VSRRACWEGASIAVPFRAAIVQAISHHKPKRKLGGATYDKLTAIGAACEMPNGFFLWGTMIDSQM
jgi:hypothetical protein